MEVGKEKNNEPDQKELETAKKIVESPRVNEIQYINLKKKQEFTEEEESEILRYEFEKSFDMHLLPDLNLTLDIVSECNKRRVKLNYKHLKEIGVGTTIQESISIIQTYGKKQMEKALSNPIEWQFRDMTNDSYSGFYHILCYKLLEYIGIDLTLVNAEGCIERHSNVLYECIKTNIDNLGSLNRLVDLADENIGVRRMAITKIKDLLSQDNAGDKHFVKIIGMVLLTINLILNYTYGLKLTKERKKSDSINPYSKYSMIITVPILEDKKLFPKVREHLVQRLDTKY
jgi:hypothetical protein